MALVQDWAADCGHETALRAVGEIARMLADAASQGKRFTFAVDELRNPDGEPTGSHRIRLDIDPGAQDVPSDDHKDT